MKNEHEYMHEINRLEGDRDYWRRMHAKADSECAQLLAALDEATLERDEARHAARWHRKALLSDVDIRLHRFRIGVEEWPWLDTASAAASQDGE
jgi:hypothetical protein